MIDMEIVGVQVELPNNTPVLLLREMDVERPRVLPIYIGGSEASSIHSAMGGQVPERPLTHDLFRLLFDELGIDVVEVRVVDLSDGIFYGELVFVQGRDEHTLSVRPSDAVAIAVRVGAPVRVAEAVLSEAGQLPPEPEEAPEEVLDEFKRFIDEVTPDDFAG